VKHECDNPRAKKKLVLFIIKDCPVSQKWIKTLRGAGVSFETFDCEKQMCMCDNLKINHAPVLVWRCGDDFEKIPNWRKVNFNRLKSYAAYKGKKEPKKESLLGRLF